MLEHARIDIRSVSAVGDLGYQRRAKVERVRDGLRECEWRPAHITLEATDV
jgi:hypothetical protein